MSELEGRGIYDTAISHGFSRILAIFTSKSGFSNGAIPLLLSIIPYVLALFIKESKFYYSKFDF